MPDEFSQQPRRNYHRRLLEGGIVIVIFAVGILALLQAFGNPRPAETQSQLQFFNEEQCIALLSNNIPNAAAIANVNYLPSGEVSSCTAQSSSAASIITGTSTSYLCDDIRVRWKTEQTKEYLALLVEHELPAQLVSNGTVLLDLSGQPRFVAAATYFNPNALAELQPAVELLQAQDCAAAQS